MGKVLGIDVGIASVGWSLVDINNKKIINMGVRLFDSADASNNKTRRLARSARRNLRRRKYRLKSINELLEQHGFESPDNINNNPYELRVKALTEKVSGKELYTILYHLAKRRGISYLDEAEDKEKNIGSSLNINRQLLKSKHPCQIQLERLEKYGQVRGVIEQEDKILINVFTTAAYKREAIAILENQAKFHKTINNTFIDEYIKILTRKRDFYIGPGDELNRTNYGIYKTDGRTINSIFEELIGKCSIYTEEKRASKATFTAQEFNVLNDLNNLIIEGRKLTEKEKKEIIAKILNSKVKSFTYKRMINIIKRVTGLENENAIKGYRINKKENPEFHNFEAERKLKIYLKDTSIDYENFDINKKDLLAQILSLSKDYKSLRKNCKEKLPELSSDEVSLLFKYLQENKVLYSGWHNFSVRIMQEMREDLYKRPVNQMNILIEKGIRKNIKKKFEGYKYIPPNFLDEEIYNPVVKRSVNQCVRLINAILKKYGELEAIVIEMPRETNEKDERKKIQEIEKNNEREKNEALNRIRNEYPVTREDINRQKDMPLKIRLWYQQDGRCIYTGKIISVQDLIKNPNIFEIDHIIPKSISLDDSLNNKVLVYNYANQLKGQRTPFNAFVFSNKIIYEDMKERASQLYDNKKINKIKLDLLTFEEDINKYEVRQRFINRNLVDTRYVSRVVLNGLQEFMKANKTNTQIHVVRGKFTSQIRRRWGIRKDREESYAHHGIDATIVAISYMIGQSEKTIRNPFLQRIGKKEESYWKIKLDKDYDKEVYRLPWEGFKVDMNEAIKQIKYSHKIDTKINRQISDATIYSTRKVDEKVYVVKKYKNIYNNNVAKLVIKKIKSDMDKFKDPQNSMILMRKHDPQTFQKLVQIIDKYKGEKPNPFAAYKKEHGYIKKYSKKGNGPRVKDIKYLANRLGEGIRISKTDSLSKDKKVVLLSLSPFRTDVYYNKKTGAYKNIGLKYNDLIYRGGKYRVDLETYNLIKKDLGINEDFNFLFSLYKHNIVGITYKNNPDKEERYRFLSCKSNNYNRIEVKPIDKAKFDIQNQPTIGNKVLRFKKYNTDILGNVYNVGDEKIKLEFEVDNLNNI